MKKTIRLLILLILVCSVLFVVAAAAEDQNPQDSNELIALLDDMKTRNNNDDNYYDYTNINLSSNTEYEVPSCYLYGTNLRLRGNGYDPEHGESPATITITGSGGEDFLCLESNGIGLENIKVNGDVVVGGNVNYNEENSSTYLDNVTVNGDLIIDGGGKIELRQCSISGTDEESDPFTVEISDGGAYPELEMYGGNIDKIVTQRPATLRVYTEGDESGPTTDVDLHADTELWGNVKTISVSEGAKVSFRGGDGNGSSFASSVNNNGGFKLHSFTEVGEVNGIGQSITEMYGGRINDCYLNNNSQLFLKKDENGNDDRSYVLSAFCNGNNVIGGDSERSIIRVIAVAHDAELSLGSPTYLVEVLDFWTEDGSSTPGTIQNIQTVFDSENVLRIIPPEGAAYEQYIKHTTFASFTVGDIYINPNDGGESDPTFEISIFMDMQSDCGEGINAYGFRLDLNNISDYVYFDLLEEGQLDPDSVQSSQNDIREAYFDGNQLRVTGVAADDGVYNSEDSRLVTIVGHVDRSKFIGNNDNWLDGIYIEPLMENNGVSNITYIPSAGEDPVSLPQEQTYIVMPTVYTFATDIRLGDLNGDDCISTMDVYQALKELNKAENEKTQDMLWLAKGNIYMNGWWEQVQAGEGRFTYDEESDTYTDVGDGNGDWQWRHVGFNDNLNIQDALWLLRFVAREEDYFDRIWEQPSNVVEIID